MYTVRYWSLSLAALLCIVLSSRAASPGGSGAHGVQRAQELLEKAGKDYFFRQNDKEILDKMVLQGKVTADFIEQMIEARMRPLFFAIKRGDGALIKNMLSAGIEIDPEVKSHQLNPAISWFSDVTVEDAKKDIKGKAADIGLIHIGAYTAPLHFAVYAGQQDMVALLIGSGASIDLSDEDGNSPFVIALVLDNKAIVDQLLKASEKNAQLRQNLLAPVLVMAIKEGDAKKIAELKALGADMHYEGTRGLEPLHNAVAAGDPRVVETVLALGARAGYVYKDTTPLTLAIGKEKSSEIIDILVRHGFNVNLPDADGNLPLNLAVKRKDVATVKALIRGGARADAVDRNGKSALMIAFEEGVTKGQIVDLLVAAGAQKAGLSELLRGEQKIEQKIVHKIPRSCVLSFTEKDFQDAVMKSLKKAIADKILVIGHVNLLKTFMSSENKRQTLVGILELGVSNLFLDRSKRLFIITPGSADSVVDPKTIARATGEEYGLNGLTYLVPSTISAELQGLDTKFTVEEVLAAFKGLMPRRPASDSMYPYKPMTESGIIESGDLHSPIYFFLIGHGAADYVANLPIKDLPSLFDIFTDIGTKFLLIDTCFAGGYNLLGMPKSDFPVVVQATTDLPTAGAPDFTKLFEGVYRHSQPRVLAKNELLFEGRLLEPKIMSKILRDAYGTPSMERLPSVRFPSSGVTTFFRTADLGQMEIITWRRLRSLKMESCFEEIVKKMRAKSGASAQPSVAAGQVMTAIKNESCKPTLSLDSSIKYVQIFVRNAQDLTLSLAKASYPKFISKIPGNAQHFIGTVTSDDGYKVSGNIERFVQGCFKEAYEQRLPGENILGLTPKCWFIKNFITTDGSGRQVVNDLVIFLDPQRGCSYLYKNKDGNYVRTDFPASIDKPLAVAEAKNVMFDWYKQTIPVPESLHEASGGHETLQESTDQGDELNSIIHSYVGGVPGAGIEQFESETGSSVASAVMHGDMDLMKRLIGSGADVNKTTPAGLTPLNVAVRKGNLVALQALLRIKETDVNRADPAGFTPLHQAALLGKLDFVKALMQAGARPDVKTNTGATPLDFAKKRGHAAIVKLLEGAH